MARGAIVGFSLGRCMQARICTQVLVQHHRGQESFCAPQAAAADLTDAATSSGQLQHFETDQVRCYAAAPHCLDYDIPRRKCFIPLALGVQDWWLSSPAFRMLALLHVLICCNCAHMHHIPQKSQLKKLPYPCIKVAA